MWLRSPLSWLAVLVLGAISLWWGYLGILVFSPPSLQVFSPTKNEILPSRVVSYKGHIAGAHKLLINDLVSPFDFNGDFAGSLVLGNETSILKVTAISPFGLKTNLEIPLSLPLYENESQSAR